MPGSVLSGQQHQTDAIATEIEERLRDRNVMLGLMKIREFPEGVTDTLKINQKGSLTATSATENTQHSNSVYARTQPTTLAASEVKVYSDVSFKALKFSDLNEEEVAEAAADAINDNIEQAACGLFDGFANTVGSTGVDLTPGNFRLALATLDQNKVFGQYSSVLNPIQILDMQDDIADGSAEGGAALYGNPSTDLSILGGQPPQLNGFKGSYLGVPIFSTNNTESINSGADWAGFIGNIQKAIAFAEGEGGIEVIIQTHGGKGSREVSVFIYYDVEELIDVAGVQVISDQ